MKAIYPNNTWHVIQYNLTFNEIEVHSRFPVTRPPFYERVTPPHNEQKIDPSSPTTTEWSALEFETLYFLQISQFFIPFSKFFKISIILLIVKTFLFFWKYSKIHLISKRYFYLANINGLSGVVQLLLKLSTFRPNFWSLSRLKWIQYLKNLKIFLWKKWRFRLRWDSSPGLSIAGRLL